MEPQRNLELEAAAFANLDDLDSWRVFADWLLSTGDTRGEIANLAIHLDEAFLSDRKRRVARIEELERPYIDAWHQWAQRRDLLDVTATFKRGFAHTIEGSLTQMQPVIDELFERDPIQRLILTEVESDTLARLFERNPQWLARLRYLKLQGELDEDAAAAMAAVELPELRRLNLLGMGIDAGMCRHLARLRTHVLEHLTLTANEIDDEGLAALLGSPTRGQWRELYLSGNPIDASGLGRIAADRALALTGLYVRDIEANLGDFAPFVDRNVMPTLVHLEAPGGGYWRHGPVLEQLRERFGAHLVLR